MEFLSTLWRQVSRIYGRLTPSQRATFLLLVAMIAGSLVLLVVVGGGGDWTPLTSGPLDAEQFAKAAAELDRAGIAYRDSGGQLQVATGDRYRALAALSQGSALPSQSGAFDWAALLSQKDGFGAMRSSRERELQEQVALQTELARTLREFRGVASARVVISGAPRRMFGPQPSQKAAVTLGLERGVELSSYLVESVANLVQGAVLDLKPQDVIVIDARRGIYRKVADEDMAISGNLMEQKRAAEKYLRGKLVDSLRFIPGLIADVCVELQPIREERRSHIVKPDESIIAKTLRDRVVEPVMPTGSAAEPRAGTQGSATLTPLAAALGSKETDFTEDIPEGDFSTEDIWKKIPAGTFERITALVVVPLDYYRKQLATGLPDGEKPDETDVQAQAEQDKERIRKLAQGALGPKAKPEDITVDTRYIPSEPMVAAVAATGSGFGGVAEQYGPTAVLVGLSGAFLILLSRWVKRPAMAVAPAAATGPAGEEEEESVLLPDAGKPSVEVKRLSEMRKRIEDLVVEDPNNAAGLVTRWLNQG